MRRRLAASPLSFMSNKIVFGAESYPAMQAYQDAPGGYAAQQVSVLRAHAAAGFEAWEPFAGSDEQVGQFVELIATTGLQMPTCYVNARLHTPEWRSHAAAVVETARKARDAGVKIITTNPEPVRWGGPENKTDEELRAQVKAVQWIGEELTKLGMKFAYHWHDPEFRCGAREVWTMLLNTDPKTVKVCFDTHWTYRGAGNSERAMWDLFEYTLPRIAMFHVRQSKDGVWTETFGDGDIDYRRWADRLKKAGWSGPVLLEQARESGTPQTMEFIEAQRRSLEYLRGMFNES